MRVALNAQIMSDAGFRGWNRYALNLVRHLTYLGVDVLLYAPRELDPAQWAQLSGTPVRLRQAPAMNYLRWEQHWLPRQCRADAVDVLHTPVHFGLPQFVRAKCVLTLHDVIEELYYEKKGGRRTLSQRVTSTLCRMARHRADHIVTVSEFSRCDLMRHFGIPADRISVTYEAADERFEAPVPTADRDRVRAKYRLPRKYLFYVGSVEPRKNLPFLVDALTQADLPDMHLVIGGGNPGQDARLSEAQRHKQVQRSVSFIGRVEDADLPALYAEATAFVYPSEYEGFGLQICEAMATGCPVLAADASCLPEILGSGGDTFPLHDPSTLANQIRRLSSMSEYREDLVGRAKARARAFSWDRTARATLAVYETLCSTTPWSSLPNNFRSGN